MLMAPTYSSPPRPVSHKHATVSSPSNLLVKYNRDQSDISLKWWSKKKGVALTLKEKLQNSEADVALLQEELKRANKKK
jgi:hypothetical protein